MKELCLKTVNALLVGVLCLMTLFSCTLEASAVHAVSQSERSSRVARMIDQQLTMMMSSDVADILTPEQVAAYDSFKQSVADADGRTIVSRMLEEEKGEDYLNLSYTLLTSDDVNQIISSTRPLVPQGEYEQLKAEVEKIEENAARHYRIVSRAMSTEQQAKVYKELQGLVVKAVVLLTAAVVYAIIPNVMVWGKVSAACVASVCAGILASGIMTVVGYARYGESEEDFDFPSWLKSVYDDSFAQWAIASSVIATTAAAGKSPVMTSLILVAFALYNVFDEASAMYKLVKS